MRLKIFSVVISLTALSIGLGTVWTIDQLFASVEHDPIHVDDFKSYWPGPIRPRFVATARGCSTGCTQGYMTNDDQYIAEGVQIFQTRKQAREEVERQVNGAQLVLARIPNYPTYDGNLGERIILRNVENELGGERVSILWFGDEKHLRFIEAPTWNLALEFEEYLIDTKYPDFRAWLRAPDEPVGCPYSYLQRGGKSQILP